MTINGGGAATTVIDGNGTDRVFEVIGQVALILNGVTVTNGNTSTSTVKDGGGILGANSSLVVLNNSVVTANNAATGQGGGIFSGSLTMTNSTVSQNQTSNQGGGVFVVSASISGSTISSNHSTGDQGGGLFLINGHVPRAVHIDPAAFVGRRVAGDCRVGADTIARRRKSGDQHGERLSAAPERSARHLAPAGRGVRDRGIRVPVQRVPGGPANPDADSARRDGHADSDADDGGRDTHPDADAHLGSHRPDTVLADAHAPGIRPRGRGAPHS